MERNRLLFIFTFSILVFNKIESFCFTDFLTKNKTENIKIENSGLYIKKSNDIRSNHFIFHLMQDSTVIGEIICIYEKNSVFIANFYIEPNYRSKEHAKLFLTNLVKYLRNTKTDKIRLTVYPFEKINKFLVTLDYNQDTKEKIVQLIKLYYNCGFRLSLQQNSNLISMNYVDN